MKNEEITEVVTFKTSDGRVHETRQYAMDWIKRCRLEEAFEPMAEQYLEANSSDISDSSELVEFLIENFEEIGQLYIEIHNIDVH